MFVRDPQVIIREESFGGMAFNPKTGTTIELDHEAQYLLNILGHPIEIDNLSSIISNEFHRDVSNTELSKVIVSLTDLGFVKEVKKNKKQNNKLVPRLNRKGQMLSIKSQTFLHAPESVHLTVTTKCNLDCPLCYETNKDKSEMPKEAIFALINKLAGMKVFQLALGGGEPFLREDIIDIIKYCSSQGIIPNITTNGTLINKATIEQLKNKVGGISVSMNGYSSETNMGRDPESFNDSVSGLKRLLKADIPTGVNVLVSNKNVQYLEDTFIFLTGLKVRWVNVLRLKSGFNTNHLDQYLLSKNDLIRLKKVLDRWDGILKINVDTALTCLMHTMLEQRLRENAVYGCVAGTRFCTIDCDGNVYPCSFFKGSEYKAGNILNDDFQEIWLKAPSFKKFREMKKRLKGKCGICRIKDYCGGCRSIVLGNKNDFYAEDTACFKDIGG